MAHVELSLSEPYTPRSRDEVAVADDDRWSINATAPQTGRVRRPGASDSDFNSVDRWAIAVDGANEPCLVIDAQAVIAAASQTACLLLGFDGPAEALGQNIFTDVLPLVDFTSAAAALAHAEVEKIPPVLALSSGRLARGLLRVRAGGEIITMDAVATPLWERETVIGSLTFFCLV